uniref:FAM13A-like domain-containing protein n=1 Tax=Anopheles dirus TaxID=7168 RepID=A0A182NGT6_9DIPT
MLCVQPSDHVAGTKGLIYKLAHACHIRQWKSKCGMRRPSLGQNEDDLSRLTTIISPTSISLSSNAPPAVLVNQYLPNLINSSEWQNCRKRKERQDSTSSISQDRKLIRSNSEEHLPNCQEVIRRVSSHEDFKKRAAGVVSVEISIDKENIIDEEPIESDGDDRGRQQQVFEKNLKNSADDLKKFFIGSVESVANGGVGGKDAHNQHAHQHHHHHHHHGSHTYHHLGGHHHLHHSGGKTQQAHHRLSPCRDILKSRRDSDSEQDGEHERRRHCERFSKTRPPPGRKSVSPRARNSSKHSKLAVKAGTTVLVGGSEHFYSKHDTHPTGGGGKSERRVRSTSKHREQQQQQQQQTLQGDVDTMMGDGTLPLSDYNDNNVLEKNQAVDEATQLIDDEPEEESEKREEEQEPLSPRDKLPWVQSAYADDTPALVCQRFADDKYDHATRMDSASHAKLRPVASGGSLKLYGAHHRSEENAAPSTIHHHHHHHHQKAGTVAPASNMFDERIKTINRKLGALKKKLTQFEERFEREYGCRPTHGDKSGDPAIKSILLEIHKLRKEKNQIKADLAVFAAKVLSSAATHDGTGQRPVGPGGNSEDETVEEKRLAKMKDTISDIEKRLTDKRDTEQRSENLDLLSNEQLTEEKASVQRALLYLESMYGRPASREERDAARPLYDRYRLIKRLVNRANSISGPCGVANSQMPTILEHEALAIVGTTTPSTDISPPSATSMIPSPTDTTTTTTTGKPSTNESEGTAGTTTGSSATENIHSMTTDELWQHYDATREEKKELRRTIKDFEQQFEETTGRKMLKSDRKSIEDTYALYKQKKAKLRLIDALFKKQMQATTHEGTSQRNM